MVLCRSCQRQMDNDARFCPACGRDQTVLFPPQDTIDTSQANVNILPVNAQHESGAGQTVVRGMVSSNLYVCYLLTSLHETVKFECTPNSL